MPMLLLVLILVGVPIVLIYPGWRWIAHESFGLSLVFMPVVGFIAWVIVAGVGIGAQGSANLSELFVVALISMALSYACLVLWRFRPGWSRFLIVGTFCALMVAVVCLRLLMPELGEFE